MHHEWPQTGTMLKEIRQAKQRIPSVSLKEYCRLQWQIRVLHVITELGYFIGSII